MAELNILRNSMVGRHTKSLIKKKMINLREKELDYSYEKMNSGEYAGAYWLASFAKYALIKYK